MTSERQRSESAMYGRGDGTLRYSGRIEDIIPTGLNWSLWSAGSHHQGLLWEAMGAYKTGDTSPYEILPTFCSLSSHLPHKNSCPTLSLWKQVLKHRAPDTRSAMKYSEKRGCRLLRSEELLKPAHFLKSSHPLRPSHAPENEESSPSRRHSDGALPSLPSWADTGRQNGNVAMIRLRPSVIPSAARNPKAHNRKTGQPDTCFYRDQVRGLRRNPRPSLS